MTTDNPTQDHQLKVKVNLTLAALERLIGGDSAMEVELRNQVAINFAKKYLQGQLDTAVRVEVLRLETIVKELTEVAVRRHMSNRVGVLTKGQYVLTERTHDIITRAIDTMLPELISEAVREHVTPERITEIANTEVLHHMRNQVRKQIEEAMRVITAPTQLEKPGTDGR